MSGLRAKGVPIEEPDVGASNSPCDNELKRGAGSFAGCPAGGLWRNRQAQQLATPEAFAQDPVLVWEWYAWRRQIIAGCAPNAAHTTIAQWSRRPGFTLVTQNVDGLHERAGTANVIRYHGSIWTLQCSARTCPEWEDLRVPLAPLPPKCPRCGALARPEIGRAHV